jgi:hypothetical protein
LPGAPVGVAFDLGGARLCPLDDFSDPALEEAAELGCHLFEGRRQVTAFCCLSIEPSQDLNDRKLQ